MEDKEFILESVRRLERWENTPRPVPDATRKKKRKESAGRISALITQVSELTDKISELTEQLQPYNDYCPLLKSWKSGFRAIKKATNY